MHPITGSYKRTSPHQPGSDEVFDTIVAALSTQGYAVVPHFLSADYWQELSVEVQALHAHGAFRHAGVSRQENFQIRPEIGNDQVLWLNPDAPTHQSKPDAGFIWL